VSSKKSHKILKRKWVYRGTRINFALDTVRLPDRKKAYQREVIFHDQVAVIVPQTKEKKLILIKQFRYGIYEYIWEFPAGTCDGKEPPLKCAKRELQEETQFAAKKFKKLLSFYPTPGVSTELMHVYFATELTPARGIPDEDEVIEVAYFTSKEISRMIHSGKIQDAKTILAFLYLKQSKLIS